MLLGLTLSLGAPRSAAIDTTDYLLEYTSGNIDLSSMGGRYATSDANSDGIYVDGVDFNSADITSGPINLVPPSYTGTATNGNTVTRDPGVWIYRAAGGEPVITLNWVRNESNIAGETGETYTVDTSVGDDVLGLFIKETATNADGVVSASGTVIASSINTVTNAGTAYISDVARIADLADQQKITVIYRFKLNSLSVSTSPPIEGNNTNPIRNTVGTSGNWELRVRDSTVANIVSINSAGVFTAGVWHSVMLAIDLGTDNKIIRYLDGSQQYAATYTAVANNLLSSSINMFASKTDGSLLGSVQTQYAAIYDGYLDPATYYSSFFFADNNPKLTTGTVNGVSPLFVMKGDAAAYNAGTFDVNNSGSASPVVHSATFADV